MSERKWHAVEGSSTFKPGLGRFERGEALAFVAALGIGILLFMSGSMGLPVWGALLLALAVPVPVGIFLACCMVGKPRHYAVHLLGWRWMRLTAWLAANGIPMIPKPLIEIPKNERR